MYRSRIRVLSFDPGISEAKQTPSEEVGAACVVEAPPGGGVPVVMWTTAWTTWNDMSDSIIESGLLWGSHPLWGCAEEQLNIQHIRTFAKTEQCIGAWRQEFGRHPQWRWHGLFNPKTWRGAVGIAGEYDIVAASLHLLNWLSGLDIVPVNCEHVGAAALMGLHCLNCLAEEYDGQGEEAQDRQEEKQPG